MNRAFTLTSFTLAALLGWQTAQNFEYRRIIADAKTYIGAGCRGRYQGSGDLDPASYRQETPETIETTPVSNNRVLVQCEDEHEPVVYRDRNHTRATVACEVRP